MLLSDPASFLLLSTSMSVVWTKVGFVDVGGSVCVRARVCVLWAYLDGNTLHRKSNLLTFRARSGESVRSKQRYPRRRIPLYVQMVALS